MKTTLLQLVVWGITGGALVACTGGMGQGSLASCTSYQYDDQKQSWVNANGQPVTCSVADRSNIFRYIPRQGCDFWRKEFARDPAVKFSEVIIHSGTRVPQKYCVLQRYFKAGPTGQVLLMGNYCLKQVVAGKEYRHISCQKAQKTKSGK